MKKDCILLLGLTCFLLFIFMTFIIYPTSKPKIYYSTFKNPNLNYSWDFNSSLLCDGSICGGYTYNLSYFQLKKYSLRELLISKIINPETSYMVPYEIQYKHEEGHIFTSRLLNITSPVNGINEFRDAKLAFNNLTDNISFNNYIKSVSEGIADYYAISYFSNSLSDTYYNKIYTYRTIRPDFMQHYLGFNYVNMTITEGYYSSLSNLILNLGSKDQYHSYLEFLRNNK